MDHPFTDEELYTIFKIARNALVNDRKTKLLEGMDMSMDEEDELEEKLNKFLKGK